MPPTQPPLLALLLTISTRSGPRFIFHYPPSPTLTSPSTKRAHRPRRPSLDSLTSASPSDTEPDTATAPSSTSDDDKTSLLAPSVGVSTNGTGAGTGAGTGSGRGGAGGGGGGSKSVGTRRREKGAAAGRKGRTLREDGPEGLEEEDREGDMTGTRAGGGTGYRGGGQEQGRAEWEDVLGYSVEGLEKLLSPGRETRKKRFEVGVGEVVFLGYPVFVREDGGWRKRKGRRRGGGEGEREKSRDRDKGGERLGDELVDKASFRSEGGLSDEVRSTSTSSGVSSNEMVMYHVVFVMRPRPLEFQERVGEMYDFVVKKFAKALKYEQARSGYVWMESKKILELKVKGKENGTPLSLLWPTIMQASHLARSMAHVYSAISASKIAHVAIGETVDIILQIPQPVSTPFAPTPGDPRTPGLWLTTATMLEDDGALSPHAALLLLQDKEAILKEIENDNRELASPLALFIRELTPTKSLQKMAVRLSLRLPDLLFLARHLISWRRARAIPPLHLRDIYMVSPLADMRKYPEASQVFEKRFPGLPSLSRMLQSLSSRSLPYGFLVPSQDHKAPYMEILAWLLRGNWVTQLRTFGWIRVSGDIKAKAAILARKDEQRGSTRERASKRDSTASGLSGSSLERLRTNESGTRDSLSTDDRPVAAELLSPLLKPVSDGNRSETGSVSSQKTTVQVSHSSTPGPSRLNQVSTPEPPSPFSINGGVAGPTEDSSSGIPPLELTTHEPSLILDPRKASPEESRWIGLMKESLPSDELRSTWSTISNYFDGKWALEEIAAREGMKRSRVANVVSRLELEGVLCIVRHW
ncbi:nitrogen permease regulator of amino acid transport activity 3-domain-containing protein [Elsinoe ampelina]|uniref:Nitrogen permease regulator 3 n=1 Tax=Elsinoe ampelina TaxID=302913 RepID=A0A6A6GBU4_9PEZI|nr:nitrogen permease regulator of amino acid transport activity 3-domain-containing protein [Elsinoe ampelina]